MSWIIIGLIASAVSWHFLIYKYKKSCAICHKKFDLEVMVSRAGATYTCKKCTDGFVERLNQEHNRRGN